MKMGIAVALSIALVAGSGCGSDECYERDRSTKNICDLLGDACQTGAVTEATLSEMIQVVPDTDKMPEGVVPQPSHNNLDITWYENRLYFAFRTGPTHFASEDVWMYVVSTTDQEHWELEWSMNMLRDLREPRFMQVDGKLFMFFAVLGYNPAAFEPHATMQIEFEAPCDWSEPREVFEPGFIPWRSRVIDGTTYLIGYTGGENIYEVDGEPLEVYWYKTTNGIDFEPVVAGQPIVLEGGTSETDFAFASDGRLVAISRNEAGDATGFGSKICRADPADLGTWECANDPKKYDSPLVFENHGDIYLVGRRNITDDGNYDLGRDDLSLAEQASLYNQTYWTKPKKCSLWKVDPDALAVEWVLDLPSNGDTCFASVVPLKDNQFLLYNYTSPLDDPDLKWFEGQTMSTFIYRLTLSLP